jgi:hypothetical protein
MRAVTCELPQMGSSDISEKLLKSFKKFAPRQRAPVRRESDHTETNRTRQAQLSI